MKFYLIILFEVLFIGDEKEYLLKIFSSMDFIGIFSFVKVLRERDGIPDLRRAARYRYASVTIPEVGLHLKLLLYKD